MKVNQAKLKSMLWKISKGEIASQEAAEELDITVRHLNRLMKEAGVKRPVGKRKQEMAMTVLRRAARLGATQAFVQGIVTKERAAEVAGVSIRTIERLAQRLRKGKDL
jgi:hypothetical protein